MRHKVCAWLLENKILCEPVHINADWVESLGLEIDVSQ